MSFELFAEITRNNIVESCHFGAAVICNHDGGVIKQWGNAEQLIYPRSALKPIYAIGLIESGAADHFKLSSAELALACSSHNGQKMHSDCVAKWLNRLGLKPDDLACGLVLPDDLRHMQNILSMGQGKCRLHHNCSGKHASFLTQALFLKHKLQNFHLKDHPVQQSSLNILSEMIDMDIQSLPIGNDGCGFPAPTMPLAKLAHLVASFAAPAKHSAIRRKAISRLHKAMRNNPYYVAGEGSIVSDVICITRGKVLVKSGAEGIITASIPAHGLGIAVKIADGSSRARGAVLLEIIMQMNVLSDNEIHQLDHHINPQVLNSRHEIVGEIRTMVHHQERH